MSRPVAHNKVSEPINGSIVNGDDVGNIVYTVDGAGNNYYDGYADRLWVPSAEGAAPIVFVTDTFTQGYTGDVNEAVPIFFSCAGTSSAAIIYTANRLPGMEGQNFGTAEEALTYLTRNGYFILEGNDPFEGINADSLALDLDASKMSSYPGGDTAWYDLSGNYRPADLINSPTFNSGGWFNLDGTDDRIQRTSNILTTTTGTVVMWLRTIDQTWLMIEGNTTNYYLGAIYLGGAWYNNACGSPSYYVDTNSSTNPTSEGYIDGRFHMFEAKNVNLSGWTTHQFLDYGGGTTFNMTGDVAKIQMYNRNLTAAESKQNYFGSPIVTDGLVFAVDANNIVSYPKSGTTLYNLTGSTNCTLTNGPTFSLGNGGSISLDGVDDFIDGNGNPQVLFDNNQSHSFSLWIKKSGNNSGYYAYIYDKYGTTRIPGLLFVLDSNTLAVEWWAGYWVFLNTGLEVENDIWNFVTVTVNAPGAGQTKTVNVYLYKSTGLQTATVSSAADWNASTNSSFALGKSLSNGTYFNGDIAQVLTYNKALSAAEVQQNYQATQYRFETPAGPVTNGLLLYWDAGNLDSYPGTGTTIYDLSGNGNNGTLYNGVGFNQANGGVLTFDGVDDYVRSYNPNLSTTTSTVMGAARYSGATRGRMINSTDVNWLMGHWSNSTENYYAAGWVSSVGTGTSDTNWRIYAALGNQPSDAWSLYVNNTVTATSTGGVSGPDGISIGAQTYSSFQEFSTGNFSFVLVYNRVLTAAEMTQNYNYFKGRFGL